MRLLGDCGLLKAASSSVKHSASASASASAARSWQMCDLATLLLHAPCMRCVQKRSAFHTGEQVGGIFSVPGTAYCTWLLYTSGTWQSTRGRSYVYRREQAPPRFCNAANGPLLAAARSLEKRRLTREHTREAGTCQRGGFLSTLDIRHSTNSWRFTPARVGQFSALDTALDRMWSRAYRFRCLRLLKGPQPTEEEAAAPFEGFLLEESSERTEGSVIEIGTKRFAPRTTTGSIDPFSHTPIQSGPNCCSVEARRYSMILPCFPQRCHDGPLFARHFTAFHWSGTHLTAWPVCLGLRHGPFGSERSVRGGLRAAHRVQRAFSLRLARDLASSLSNASARGAKRLAALVRGAACGHGRSCHVMSCRTICGSSGRVRVCLRWLAKGTGEGHCEKLAVRGDR